MKQFEKWHNKAIKNPANFSFDRRSCAASWRAAFEEMREYMTEQEPDALYFDYVLLDKIEQELGDT